MVKKMLKVQVIEKNVQPDVQKFSRWKTGLEDFGNNRDLCSRLPLTRVRKAKHFVLVIGDKKFRKDTYEQEQVRGARARV